MNLEKFKKIAIIGLGFMGIALAKSLKKLNFFINGCDLDKNLSDFLLKEKIIDKNFDNLNQLVKESDIIFLTTPIIAFRDIASKIANELTKQIVVDFGSVKCISGLIEAFGDKKELFIPSHPICGGKSINANGNLKNELKRINNNIFKERLIHFFPKNSNSSNLQVINDIFVNLGAKVDISLTLQEHDKVYALTSHLPTFLSFNMFLSLQKGVKSAEFFKNKLLDKMWHSVFIENVDNIEFWLKNLNNFLKDNVNCENLAAILKDLVNKNRLKKYTGNGYLQFINLKDNKNSCKLNDFLDNQNKLLSICRNKNMNELSQTLLTTWEKLR